MSQLVKASWSAANLNGSVPVGAAEPCVVAPKVQCSASINSVAWPILPSGRHGPPCTEALAVGHSAWSWFGSAVWSPSWNLCVIPFSSRLCAVAQYPNSVPVLWRIDGTSWNTDRLHFVAEPFQVNKDSVEPHVEDSSRIFITEPSGLDDFSNADSLRPEPTVITRASLFPGSTCGLARRTPCEQPHAAVSFGGEGFDVAVARDTPGLLKAGGEPFFALAEGEGSHAIRSGCECPASKAAEKVDVSFFIGGHRSASWGWLSAWFAQARRVSGEAATYRSV